jgi:hypothetical protein
MKLSDFQNYYNKFRVHGSLENQTPVPTAESKRVSLKRGRNTVALYTKRQEPREDEFAIDTNTSASIPPETSEILGESRLNGDSVGSEIRTPTGEASAGTIVGRPKV